VFVEKNSTVDFLRSFDLIKSEGTLKVKFFDLGLSETVDEYGFGS